MRLSMEIASPEWENDKWLVLCRPETINQVKNTQLHEIDQ